MATLVRAEQRLAHLAKPTYDLLLDALRRSGVVHADETGWKVGRLNAWLWVFSNDQTTVYTIRTGKGSRGHTVPGDILGPDFNGFLIVDGFKAYEVLEYAKGQCNGHLLRRGKELNDTLPSHEARRVRKLVQLIQQAIDLAQRRDQLTPAGYARRVQTLENRLDRWLDRVPAQCSDDLARLDKHLRKHRGEWFVFLHEPAVPPTNNHAERMLRPAVISRKIGGCNQTLAGALVHSILASLMATCHQQGQKFLDLARKLWHAGQPCAVRILTRRPA
jgi:transposase